MAPANEFGFNFGISQPNLRELTSQDEGQEGDGESLQGDELDDGEHNLDNDGLLQFQGQEQRQQHLLHALAAGFCFVFVFISRKKSKESGELAGQPKVCIVGQAGESFLFSETQQSMQLYLFD